MIIARIFQSSLTWAIANRPVEFFYIPVIARRDVARNLMKVNNSSSLDRFLHPVKKLERVLDTRKSLPFR